MGSQALFQTEGVPGIILGVQSFYLFSWKTATPFLIPTCCNGQISLRPQTRHNIPPWFPSPSSINVLSKQRRNITRIKRNHCLYQRRQQLFLAVEISNPEKQWRQCQEAEEEVRPLSFHLLLIAINNKAQRMSMNNPWRHHPTPSPTRI